MVSAGAQMSLISVLCNRSPYTRRQLRVVKSCLGRPPCDFLVGWKSALQVFKESTRWHRENWDLLPLTGAKGALKVLQTT